MEQRDEPLTPAGRLFVRPETSQIINCAVGLKHPIDIEAIKLVVSNSLMIKHPRFTSLLVTDSHGREYWRKTEVHVDRHVIVVDDPSVGPGEVNEEDVINDYLADLSVSSPLSTDKPLWELHLLMAQRCAVLRLHHALGDGISLMSMFLTCCRSADNPDQLPSINSSSGSSASSRSNRRENALWRIVVVAWFTVVYVIEFVLRTLWVGDQRTAVSGGAGVELWPRKLATASFCLEDMKTIKRAVADVTINDVLFGVISSGLSRYLDIRNPEVLQEGLQMTGVAMVNLRPQPGLQEMSKLMESDSVRWGNKFGMMLLPIYYHSRGSDPLHYLKRAKAMIDRKKKSLEAHFSYNIGHFVMTKIGPKLASLLNYRILCNTTFTISNVIGPSEKITVAGNLVTFIRVTSSGLPHGITMHMVSYAGRADMQILVAKDLIPDPQILSKCFTDALLEMKQLAESKIENEGS